MNKLWVQIFEAESGRKFDPKSRTDGALLEKFWREESLDDDIVAKGLTSAAKQVGYRSKRKTRQRHPLAGAGRPSEEDR